MKFINSMVLLLIILSASTVILKAEEQLMIEKVQETIFQEPIKNVVFWDAPEKVMETNQSIVRGAFNIKTLQANEIYLPRSVETSNKVIWYQKNGSKLKELEYGELGKVDEINKRDRFNRVHLLKNGNVLIDNYISDYYHMLFYYDENGNLQWSKEVGNVPMISGNEKYIVTGKQVANSDGEDACKLFDANGTKKWSRKFRFDMLWKVHIFHSGKVAIIASKDVLPGREIKWETTLTIIDTDGSVLWTYKDFGSGSYFDVFSGEEENLIIYVTESAPKTDEIEYQLYGFDNKGKLLWPTIKHTGLKNIYHYMDISEKGNVLAGFTFFDELWAMDILTGQRMMTKKLSEVNIYRGKGRKIYSELSSNGKYLALRTHLRNTSKTSMKPGEFDEFILIDTKTGEEIIRDQNNRGVISKGSQILKIDKSNAMIFEIKQ